MLRDRPYKLRSDCRLQNGKEMDQEGEERLFGRFAGAGRVPGALGARQHQGEEEGRTSFGQATGGRRKGERLVFCFLYFIFVDKKKPFFPVGQSV